MGINEIINRHKDKVVSLVVILVSIHFALMIYKKEAEILAALKEKKETETKKNQVLEGIGKSKEKYDDYKSFINNKELSNAINILSAVATSSSAKIVSVRPAPEENRQLYTYYAYDLKVEVPSYHVLGKFISNLESHPAIFSVDTMTVGKQEDVQKREFKLVADMRVSTFLLKK